MNRTQSTKPFYIDRRSQIEDDGPPPLEEWSDSSDDEEEADRVRYSLYILDSFR